MEQECGVEPLSAFFQSFRAHHAGLTNSKSIETAYRGGNQSTDEPDEAGERANHTNQAIVYLAEGHEEPAAGEETTGEREKRTPISGDDIKEDAAVFRHDAWAVKQTQILLGMESQEEAP